ncbi:hypothetical protein T265_09796 [Opisthorchis viverrini]|uniref:Uncharacterized protein n=1 Tax=Opisthorchis viverrini TaxID=6198 RepID=A0A075A3M4_OPIVI|nr:hypothetical protein T265_09796 [Opisthorchis viverrini]KER21999.1 hypothetical protein T265_09796 [Opisthorchis viverrini]
MYAAGVEEVKALLLARANELANRRPEDRRRSSVFERSHKIASDLCLQPYNPAPTAPRLSVIPFTPICQVKG